MANNRAKRIQVKAKMKSTTTDLKAGRSQSMIKSSFRIHKESQDGLIERENYLLEQTSGTRAAASQMAVDAGAAPDGNVPTIPWGGDDSPWVDEDDDEDIPAGISHAGGEITDAARVWFERATRRKRYPSNVLSQRRERLRALQGHWSEQMPSLVDAYLLRKHGHVLQPSSPREDGEAAREDGEATREDSYQPMEGVQEAGTSDESFEGSHFEVEAISTFAREELDVRQKVGEPANVSLLRIGFLGCAPLHPEKALSLDTLELYHRLRRRHGQLSIQTMARTLCDLHDVTYKTSYRDQLSIAFDAYLCILRHVKTRTDDMLGRNTPHWRAKNACPPCNYRLEDEEPLIPRAMHVMDGGFSAKRTANAGLVDQQKFHSTYLLSREYVNLFKDEVKKRKPPEVVVGEEVNLEDEERDAPWAGVEAGDSGGDPTDNMKDLTPCAETWKASAAANKKGAFEIYEITGHFPVACRHGLIEAFCEIVRTGEQAKYPLAIAAFILEVFGSDALLAFDIACSFEVTIGNSALLGDRVREARMDFVVNAFHGWAHNRLCQLQYHPLYRQGLGLEDLETLERIFSSSNAVARTVRHATQFHWMQAMDLHYRQWDEEKYQELSNFILGNYKQALDIIADYGPEVENFKLRKALSDSDIESWIPAEKAFLLALKREPDERVQKCTYVEALVQLRIADDRWVSSSQAYTTAPPTRVDDYAENTRATSRLESNRRNAMDLLHVAIRSVADIETKLCILVRWDSNHPEFKATAAYMKQRDFHRALDKLQQLVVQRLFELSKANAIAMGYKLRESIWRALKTRGKAIRTALVKYNAIAPLMEPPAPPLEWKQLMDYAFVSEFELLKHRHSHVNIIHEPWAEPGNREMTTKFYKLRGARVEIIRCNVEARRLATSIRDEHLHYETTIQHVQATSPLLASALQQQYDTRRRVNFTHLVRLEELYALAGFSGLSGCGVRAANESLPADDGAFRAAAQPQEPAVPQDVAVGDLPDDENPSDDEEEPDDAMQNLLDGLASTSIGDHGIPKHMMGGWDSSQV